MVIIIYTRPTGGGLQTAKEILNQFLAKAYPKPCVKQPQAHAEATGVAILLGHAAVRETSHSRPALPAVQYAIKERCK